MAWFIIKQGMLETNILNYVFLIFYSAAQCSLTRFGMDWTFLIQLEKEYYECKHVHNLTSFCKTSYDSWESKNNLLTTMPTQALDRNTRLRSKNTDVLDPLLGSVSGIWLQAWIPYWDRLCPQTAFSLFMNWLGSQRSLTRTTGAGYEEPRLTYLETDSLLWLLLLQLTLMLPWMVLSPG